MCPFIPIQIENVHLLLTNLYQWQNLLCPSTEIERGMPRYSNTLSEFTYIFNDVKVSFASIRMSTLKHLQEKS